MKILLSLILLFTLTACTLGERRPNQTEPSTEEMPATATTAAVNMPASTPTDATTAKGNGTRKAKSQPTGSSATPIAQASGTPGDLRGIYVDSNAFPISNSDETAYSASLNVPGVDGLVLVFGWDGLEPSMGQYQWNTLDQWVSTAVPSGKKVELSIRADYHTPSWLFQPAPGGGGAKALNFSFTRKPEDTTCLSETLAAPWDSAFLTQWDAMLAAVSAHLKSTGTYNSVTLLRLTGINKDSDELHLPSQTSGAACVTNAVNIWQQAGYRPSLLLQGWDGITNSFKNNFPDKSFSVANIAGSPPFPGIAENGSMLKGTSQDQNLPLLTLASKKFPGHLVIQNNSLYPDVPAQSETVQAVQSLGTMIAFQTNEDIRGQGASCGVPTGGDRTTPCTSATFLNELQTGIYPLGKSNSLRAQYIEVFALNVNALPDAIQQAHNELLGQP